MIITSLRMIICFVLVFASCITNSSQKDTGWVFDREGDLTKEQIFRLDSLFKDHERRTTNEIVLVTTPDYGNDSTLLSYAVNFGRQHNVGKKNINNGVVIVFNGTRHETRISTGYGTEKILKDEIGKRIIDSLMIPQFKKGNYYEGLWQGSIAIVNFLERPENKIK